MDKNLLREVRWAIETLNPYIRFDTLENKCNWARNILDPKTQMQELGCMSTYQGLEHEHARSKAIEDACIIACNAMDYYLKKEAIIYEELEKVIGAEDAIKIMKQADKSAEFLIKRGQMHNG